MTMKGWKRFRNFQNAPPLLQKFKPLQHINSTNLIKNETIDDYAKDGGPREVWLSCSFYQDPLRVSATKNVNSFIIWNCTSLKSITETYESNLKVTMEFEFHILPNKKIGIAKDHGKNYIAARPPMVRHL